MMVGIEIEMFKDIEDDLDFCKKMVDEVQVFCLPSKCFSSKNMFRVVLCNTKEKFEEMGRRIEEFVSNHLK